MLYIKNNKIKNVAQHLKVQEKYMNAINKRNLDML